MCWLSTDHRICKPILQNYLIGTGTICIKYIPIIMYGSSFVVSRRYHQIGPQPVKQTAKSGNMTWWRHQMETFSASLALCEGNPPVNGDAELWRGALTFSLISAWTNGWANNREAGDLRRHRAHYDATLMITTKQSIKSILGLLCRQQRSIARLGN